MIRVFQAALVITLSIFISVALRGESKSLTNEQKLKAELFKLKAQLSQCMLTSEQKDLVYDFANSLGAKPGSQFDWSTLSFKESMNSTQFKASETLEKKP